MVMGCECIFSHQSTEGDNVVKRGSNNAMVTAARASWSSRNGASGAGTENSPMPVSGQYVIGRTRTFAVSGTGERGHAHRGQGVVEARYKRPYEPVKRSRRSTATWVRHAPMSVTVVLGRVGHVAAAGTLLWRWALPAVPQQFEASGCG